MKKNGRELIALFLRQIEEDAQKNQKELARHLDQIRKAAGLPVKENTEARPYG